MSRHRSPRPRYGRIALATVALAITVFAVLGGMGVVPTAPSAADGADGARLTGGAADAGSPTPEPVTPEPVTPEPVNPATLTPEPEVTAGAPKSSATSATATAAAAEALPTDAGAGRRVVFSESEQRVWLVRSNGSVRRTYLVSGSLEDNLDPGTYSVFSRSRWAVGIDDSGVMEFFVRFAHGEQAAIGFHTIPTKLGTPLQARAQLGTPQSHGCIRQAKADAISLWKFAAEGTEVVVV